MNEIQIILGLLVGLVPYRIVRRCFLCGGPTLEAKALFWSVTVNECDWTVRIPLIERVSDAAWAAIMRLRDDESSQD